MFFHFAYAILLLVNFCKADPCKDLLLSSTNDTELLSKLHSNINSLYNYSSLLACRVRRFQKVFIITN